jgi:hypothetical protein
MHELVNGSDIRPEKTGDVPGVKRAALKEEVTERDAGRHDQKSDRRDIGFSSAERAQF